MERSIGYPAAMVEEIQVRLGGAQVELLGAEIQEVQILIQGDERSVRETIAKHEDGKLLIEQPRYSLLPHFDHRELRICVRVPQAWRGNVLLITVSGAITAKNLLGTEIHLDTASGAVQADHLQCDALIINAVAGVIQANHIVTDRLHARNVSNTIGLFDVEADTVKLISISGQALLDFRRPFASLELQVASGDAQVRLPDNRAEVIFRSVSGKLSAPDIVGGDGAPVLRATTIAGNLRISSRAAERADQQHT